MSDQGKWWQAECPFMFGRNFSVRAVFHQCEKAV